MSPFLPIIEDEFAISHALAGSLFFFFFLGSTLAVFSAGYLSSRIGYKRSITASFIVLIAALFCLRYSPTYSSFAFISFFMGIGAGIYVPCAIPMITAIFDPGKWGKAISFHETAASASITAVPLMTVFALQYLHWRSLFLVLGAGCAIAVAVLWIFSPDPRPMREKKAGLISVMRRTDFWVITILWTFSSIDCMAIYNIIPLFLVKEKGLPFELANKLFGISRIGGFLAVIMIGFFLDRYRFRALLSFTVLAMGITTFGLAIAHQFWFLVAMLFMQATFSVIFFPAGLVAISKLTSLNERSTFTGTVMGISGILGTGLTPFILGALADAWSFQIGILAFGVLTTGSCLLIKSLKGLN